MDNPIPNASTSRKDPKKEKSVIDLTEDEQMDLALKASMGTSTEFSSNVKKQEEPVTLEHVFKKIKTMDAAEPTSSKDTTRIQIRFADGSRVVRNFNKSDKVEVFLYECNYRLFLSF